MNYAQMKNAPAFPVAFKWGRELSQYNGMTLRDYFAAKAMQALINRDEWQSTLGEISRDTAFMAYVMADAMLQERKSDASAED